MLRVSMVGYVPYEQTVNVAEDKVVLTNVQLKVQTGRLGEVVVQAICGKLMYRNRLSRWKCILPAIFRKILCLLCLRRWI